MSDVSTIIPESASELPVLSFKKASFTMLISLELFSNSPVIVRFPSTVVLPVSLIFPVAPSILNDPSA